MKKICKQILKSNSETRHPLHKGLAALVLTTAFAACTNESESINLPGEDLQVSFTVNAPESRAIFKGTELAVNSKVGAKLGGYDSYSSLFYTYKQDGPDKYWDAGTDIVLSDTEGTFYSYFPYSSNVDITAIPVDMTAADQTDWLYGVPVTKVNEDKADIAVTLNHALANINVTLADGTYAGTGNVSSISVQSAGIARKGTFNAA